jgi:hypothetical protein
VTASIRAKNADGTIDLDVNGAPLNIREKMTQQLFVVPVG